MSLFSRFSSDLGILLSGGIPVNMAIGWLTDVQSSPITSLLNNRTFEAACEQNNRNTNTYLPIHPLEGLHKAIRIEASPSRHKYHGYIDLQTSMNLGPRSFEGLNFKAARVSKEGLMEIYRISSQLSRPESIPEGLPSPPITVSAMGCACASSDYSLAAPANDIDLSSILLSVGAIATELLQKSNDKELHVKNLEAALQRIIQGCNWSPEPSLPLTTDPEPLEKSSQADPSSDQILQKNAPPNSYGSASIPGATHLKPPGIRLPHSSSRASSSCRGSDHNRPRRDDEADQGDGGGGGCHKQTRYNHGRKRNLSNASGSSQGQRNRVHQEQNHSKALVYGDSSPKIDDEGNQSEDEDGNYPSADGSAAPGEVVDDEEDESEDDDDNYPPPGGSATACRVIAERSEDQVSGKTWTDTYTSPAVSLTAFRVIEDAERSEDQVSGISWNDDNWRELEPGYEPLQEIGHTDQWADRLHRISSQESHENLSATNTWIFDVKDRESDYDPDERKVYWVEQKLTLKVAYVWISRLIERRTPSRKSPGLLNLHAEMDC